jgi:hypothetical protein
MAAAIKTTFDIREVDEFSLFRSSDDKGRSSVAASPKVVFTPIKPLPTFKLGAAQRSASSNGGQSANIEPQTGTQHILNFEPPEPVLHVPSISQQNIKFQKLQEYEGAVLSIRASDFLARLVDLTDICAQRLEAIFSIDEVSPSDLPLLHEGAVFYWIIGSRDYRNGQRKTEQFLRFRRLPIWSKRDIERLDARVYEMKGFLQSDDE